jgi:N-acetylneuraminic acid mutarotase
MKQRSTNLFFRLLFTFLFILGLNACGGGDSQTSPPASPINLWTWMSGSDVANPAGVYGTKGIANAANVPVGRRDAVSWSDSSGNLWLFGGQSGAWKAYNDLWRFDGSNWIWVSGSDTTNQTGVYGTKGTVDATNVPGAREDAISWTDSSGNLWLFGGRGYDSTGTRGELNDLWKYDGTNWTWMSGSNLVNQAGVYGTLGVADAANVPCARRGGVSWTDSSGNLWLFGGYGLAIGYLNDLWKYDGTNWTWMNGSILANHPAVYGTQGVADAANMPGVRQGAISWIDSSDNLWLFGGAGYDSTGASGYLNDLWKYDGSNWTWVSGSNTRNQIGVYGTQGVADAANVPGARYYSVSWTDSSGNLWLFGRVGIEFDLPFNDLWKFDGTNWTWVNGSNLDSQTGDYGTQGTADAANVPGARGSSVSWADSSGNLWLFGGTGYDSTGSLGYLNDLWRYQP